MKILLIGALVVAACGLVIYQSQGEYGQLRKDMNGMILGDDTKPAQPLYVGVGDTVTRLMERNSYLKKIKPPRNLGELRLSLMTKLDVHYDDGDIKLDVGCASTVNIDGDERFPDAAFIGIKLCEQPLNDWKPALQLAADIMYRLEQQNSQVQNLYDFYVHASESELQKIGGDIWSQSQEICRRFNDELCWLRTIEEADAKFSQEAATGNKEVVSGKQVNTYANVGVYVGKYSVFEIGVSKVANFGGSNLTEAQRRTMRYVVTMSFRLRNDVDPMFIKR